MRLQGLKNTKNFTLSLSVCDQCPFTSHVPFSTHRKFRHLFFNFIIKALQFPGHYNHTSTNATKWILTEPIFFLNLQLKTSMPFNVSWRRLSTCSKMCECSYVDSVHRSTCDLMLQSILFSKTAAWHWTRQTVKQQTWGPGIVEKTRSVTWGRCHYWHHRFVDFPFWAEAAVLLVV